MKKLYTFILSILLLYINGFAQTTITLPCSQDVELFSLSPNTPQNTGSYGNQLNANAWTYVGPSGYERSLLDFDWSQIPVGATIQSATLNLYNNFYCNDDALQNGQHSHLSGSNASVLQRVLSSWSENTATWNNQPTATAVNEVALPQDTNPNQNYSVDVTALVEDIIANAGYGFILQLDTEQHYRCLLFASSRHPDSTLHPNLVVTYIIPCISLTLQPNSATGKDVMLDTHNGGNINYEGGSSLNSTAWTDIGVPYQQRSLIQFDISSIPASSIIQSAFLTLYNNYTDNESGYLDGTHSHVSGSNQSFIQRITSSWLANTATWNNPPSSTAMNQVIVPQDTMPHQDYTLDVRQLVQDMIDSPATSFGFMLQLDTEQYYRCMIFASSDHPNAALHPKLEVCYKRIIEGISEINLASIKVFPNPSSGSFTILLPDNLQAEDIQIFNAIGQQVYKETMARTLSGKKEISLKAAAGIYFLNVRADAQQLTQKLLIR